jgi:hypothetical protein
MSVIQPRSNYRISRPEYKCRRGGTYTASQIQKGVHLVCYIHKLQSLVICLYHRRIRQARVVVVQECLGLNAYRRRTHLAPKTSSTSRCNNNHKVELRDSHKNVLRLSLRRILEPPMPDPGELTEIDPVKHYAATDYCILCRYVISDGSRVGMRCGEGYRPYCDMVLH